MTPPADPVAAVLETINLSVDHAIEVNVADKLGGTLLRSLEVHPLALVMPVMTPPEIRRCYQDIDRHGIAEPLTLFEGKILDGRHRLAIAHLTGKTVYLRDFPGSRDAARSFVFSSNLMRRHLTQSQMGQAIMEWLAAEAKADATITTRAARKGGWAYLASQRSGRLISPQSLHKLDQARLEDAPETMARVQSGEIKTIAEAARAAAIERGEQLPEPIKTSVGDHVAKAKYSIQRAVEESDPDNFRSDPTLLRNSLAEIEEACRKLREIHQL